MALTAIPVGFVAGLFGIGGGLITVPFLYFIFGSLEIDPQYVMHLAVDFLCDYNTYVYGFSFNTS